MSIKSELPSNDPLQKLLRESLHLQMIAKNKSVSIQANKLLQEYRDRLHKTENWIPSGVITLIHTSEDGTQTTLGIFQEFRNKFVREGRKLVRVESDLPLKEDELRQEYVSGQLWINGKQVLQQEPNYHSDPADQDLIRDYLKRTAPISLTQQLKELQAEHLLRELLMSDVIWERI